MHDRPPECSQCPHAVQTRLKVFAETGYEEWLCCGQCPRLAALRPESENPEELSCELLKEGSSLPHAPEVLRVLAEKGLVRLDPALMEDLQALPPPPVTRLILALKMELDHALSQERYEDAARIRDLLQSLETEQL